MTGQEVALPNLQATIENLIAPSRVQLQLSLNDDALGRSALANSDTLYLNGVQVQVSTAVSTFTSTQVSRAVVAYANLTVAGANISAADLADFSTALVSEVSRATYAQTGIIAAAPVRAGVSNGSATDDMNWYVSWPGSMRG